MVHRKKIFRKKPKYQNFKLFMLLVPCLRTHCQTQGHIDFSPKFSSKRL